MNVLIVGHDEGLHQDLGNLLGELCPQVVPVPIRGRHQVRGCFDESPQGLVLDVESSWGVAPELIQEAGLAGVPVVAITSDRSFAVTAYELGAVDCLLKPLERSRFDLALSRLRSNAPAAAPRELIVFADSLNVWPVKPAEIVMIQGEGGYTVIHLVSKPPITISKNLSEIEQQIGGDAFFRANRSTIINIHYVGVLRRIANGCLSAEFSGHQPVLFSRRQSQIFRKRYIF